MALESVEIVGRMIQARKRMAEPKEHEINWPWAETVTRKQFVFPSMNYRPEPAAVSKWEPAWICPDTTIWEQWEFWTEKNTIQNLTIPLGYAAFLKILGCSLLFFWRQLHKCVVEISNMVSDFLSFLLCFISIRFFKLASISVNPWFFYSVRMQNSAKKACGYILLGLFNFRVGCLDTYFM